jgi:4'-phosphopantetheinyl transferase
MAGLTISSMNNYVDLWIISLPIDTNMFINLKKSLNHQELSYTDSFKSQILKNNAIASRGGLRAILAKYLDLEPNLISIEKNSFGKPYVPNSNIRFNVSHSGKYILVAVATDINMGVDIERISDDFDYSEIIDSYFNDNERLCINSESTDGRKAFYRAWTRKEACLKSIGAGLSLDLKDIEVSCAETDTPQVISFKGFHEHWELYEIDIDPQYMVSLALETSSPYSINKLEFR